MFTRRAEQKPQLITAGNPKSLTLMFTFHKEYSEARSCAKTWMNDHLQHRVYAGFPNSSQQSDLGLHWAREEQAVFEAEKLFHTFQTPVKTTPEHVLLSGAGQGGSLAIRLALTGQLFSPSTFFVWEPALTNLPQWETLLKHADKDVQGWLIASHMSASTTQHEAFIDMCEYFDVDCRYIIRQSPPSQLPTDFHALINEALTF
ncbi:hypothetical protein B0H94_102273 [Salsuginibacillus halophilus]|uniref:Esterase n=1 Tax=Salsuginibacillus halophilus TaxID=517424 RepID=A0A2P8HXM8_9BACI|nr:hypothetical protein [Salsuginibacillus halophilus]PSL50996.1 hypothetical protein B0H94_102273 [Salsuginibacillus halophilus]